LVKRNQEKDDWQGRCLRIEKGFVTLNAFFRGINLQFHKNKKAYGMNTAKEGG